MESCLLFKRKQFLGCSLHADASYGWQKIIHICNEVRQFFVHKIGNGESAYSWFDKWNDNGPLNIFITHKDIHRAGFNVNAKVKDLINEHGWTWPIDWSSKYDVSNVMEMIQLNDVNDKLMWRNVEGKLKEFSIHMVW